MQTFSPDETIAKNCQRLLYAYKTNLQKRCPTFDAGLTNVSSDKDVDVEDEED